MEDIKQQKQTYLRINIMEQGYDAQEFLLFISQQKEGGQNLDIWTLKELQNIVQEFTKQAQPVCIAEIDQNDDDQQSNDDSEDADIQLNNQVIYEAGADNSSQYDKYEQRFMQKFENSQKTDEQLQKDNQQQNQQQQEEDIQEIQQTIENQRLDIDINEQNKVQQQQSKEQIESIYFQKYNVRDTPYYNQIKCDKHLSLIPIYQKIKIQVSEPLKESEGLFGIGKNYSFKINTKPYNWEVRRKMKDFVLLRSVISKLFPAKIIPPLDEDNTEQNMKNLNKRMKYLQSFLSDLKYQHEIWSNQYVIDFLSMQDDSKFPKILKNSEKEKEIEKIKDMSNMVGSFTADLSNGTHTYKEEAQKYLNFAEGQYKKLQICSKQLKTDFENISKTLANIGVAYKELFVSFNDFDSKLMYGKESNQKLKDSYISFNNILMSWSRSMSQSCTQISDKLTHFFKYSHHEIDSFKDMYKKVNESEKQYFKYKSSLDDKKEKLFKTGDFSKWEIETDQKEEAQKVKHDKKKIFQFMCSRDTKYQRYLKEQYAFWVSQICQQFQKGFQKKSEDYLDFFKSFAKAETNILNELLGSWGKITKDYGFENPFPNPKELVPGRFSVNLDDNQIIAGR